MTSWSFLLGRFFDRREALVWAGGDISEAKVSLGRERLVNEGVPDCVFLLLAEGRLELDLDICFAGSSVNREDDLDPSGRSSLVSLEP